MAFEDNFTENDVLRCLDLAGLEHKNGSRYILTQCPMPDHNDKHPSAQIYKDDWFVSCLARCGRFHITKAFPDLLDSDSESSYRAISAPSARVSAPEENVMEHQYKTFDLMEEWKTMPAIPDDFSLHGVPGEVLQDMGWRWLPGSIFIPYFSRTRATIPFVQYRHLTGERRFTMLKDAKPTCYGTWNLPTEGEKKIFVVEGTSDCAVLEYCGVPWIGMPSAASGALLAQMAAFCVDNDITIIYAGDNDVAGSKLLDTLEEVAPFRLKQVPSPYKDWGEFLEGKGLDIVRDYAQTELGFIAGKNKDLENVQAVFPGAILET